MDEKQITELIERVRQSEKTRKQWQKNYSSKEWKEASKLHNLINGIPLNRGGCVDCVSDLFFQLKRNNFNLIIMKQQSKKFHLPKGTVIQLHGCDIITEHSSDAQMMRLLKIDKGQISKFTTYPENWRELINDSEDVEENLDEAQAEDVDSQDEESSQEETQTEEDEESSEEYKLRKEELLEKTNGELKSFMSANKIEIPNKAKKADLVEAILQTEFE